MSSRVSVRAGATIAHEMAATPARQIAIDGLRGLSILVVVLYHYVGHEGAGSAYWSPAGYGNYGVMLFFMISGYCIMLSVDSSRTPWDFWSKRLSRLMPGLVVCGALTTGLKQLLDVAPERVVTWGDFATTLVALPTLNLAGIDYRPPDGAYWSLIAEFQFYALIVVFMLLGARRHLLEALLLLEALVLVFASIQELNLAMVFAYLPAFIVGVAFKRLADNDVHSSHSAWLGLAGALLVMVFGARLGISDASMPADMAYMVAFVLCTGLFYLTLRFPASVFNGVGTWLIRGASLLGVVSYPLYLLHQDIGEMLHQLLTRDLALRNGYFLRLILMPAIMIALATMVYRIVEKPFIPSLNRLLSKIPAPFSVLLNRCGAQLLPSHPLLFRSLSLSVIVLAIVTILFVKDGSQLDLATQMARQISIHQIAGNHEKPWGGIQFTPDAEEMVVDFRSVPVIVCPALIQHLQCLQGVKRLAVGTQAKDEIPVPLAYSDIVWRCAGIQSKTVRLIMDSRPVESMTC